jgi:uncharacterized cupredoxin-like copper-binding protein
MPAMRPTALRRAGIFAGAATLLLTAAVPAVAGSSKSMSLKSYKISGASSAKHGKVTFHVSNSAKVEHEMVIIKTSKKAADLPTTKSGAASEKGAVGEIEVGAHGSKSATFNLPKGHYALICNLHDHYKRGMHKDFTVN